MRITYLKRIILGCRNYLHSYFSDFIILFFFKIKEFSNARKNRSLLFLIVFERIFVRHI